MSWLFSQALGEAYSAGTCSDGEPFAALNLTDTRQPFSRNGKTMDFSRLSPSGVTSRRLTADHGAALLTSYLAAFPVRTSPQPVEARESQEPEADSGRTWRAWFAKFDPDTCSWRTPQSSLLVDSESFSETWPRWGSMRSGECSRRLASGPTIAASESGYWPTPVAHDDGKTPEAHMAMKARMKGGPRHTPTSLTVVVKGIERGMFPTPTVGGGGQTLPEGTTATGKRPDGTKATVSLEQFVKFPTPRASDGSHGGPNQRDSAGRPGLAMAAVMFPTPCATDSKGSGKSGDLRDRLDYAVERGATKSNTYAASQGGQLNPTWVEWLMGWPIGWTVSEPLATDRFREWSSQHSPRYTSER